MADRRLGRRYSNDRKMRAGATSLDELYRIFYNAKVAEGKSPRTLETYEENYRFFCDFLADENIDRDYRHITVDTVRAYITYLLKTKRRWEGHPHKAEEEKTVGLKPSTVNTRLKGLRTMYTFLYAEGYLPENIFAKIKPVAEEDEEIEIMTDEQLARILRQPDKKTYVGFRDYTFMVLLIDGFLRLNEGLHVKRADINFDLALLKIPAANAKSRRSKTVPLDRQTLNLLRDLIRENEDYDTDYVFLTNYGERLTDDRMRDRIKLYAERAEIEVNVYPHLFRHTAATIYLENGGDVRSLAELMGHADLRQVMRYTHLSKASISLKHSKFSPIHNVTNKLAKARRTIRN